MRQLVASTVAGQNTYTFPSAIKKANFTKAVVAVMAGFTDAGTWDMGITGNTTYFGTGNLNGSNGYNRFGTTNYAANALPKYFTADSDLIITLHPVGTLPAGLSLNIFIFEETYTV